MAESVGLEITTIQYLATYWDYDLRVKNANFSLAGISPEDREK
jgi:hypothetical protein